MTGYDIFEFIKHNLGHINFEGETNHDRKSLENLEKYDELITILLYEINDVFDETKDRPEFSGKQLHKKTGFIIRDIKELYENFKIKDYEVK